MENFSCEVSSLAWKLYESTHEIGMLMLYLNVEHFDELVLNQSNSSDNANNYYNNDGGMEL